MLNVLPNQYLAYMEIAMSDTTPKLLGDQYPYPHTLIKGLCYSPNIKLEYKGETVAVTVRQDVMFDIGPITASEINKYDDKGYYPLQYPEVTPGVLPTPRLRKFIDGKPNPYYDTYTPPILTEAEVTRLHAEVQTLKLLWEREIGEITPVANLLSTWPVPNKRSIDTHGIRYYYHCPIHKIYLRVSASKGIPSLRMPGRVWAEIIVNRRTIDTITLPIVNGVINRTPILEYLANNQLLEMGNSLKTFGDRLGNN